MSVYIKLKLLFEGICSIFYLGVLMLVIFSRPCTKEMSTVLLVESILGLATSAFSVACIKDGLPLNRQTIVHTVLGVLFIPLLSYGFYLLQTMNCVYMWIFSFCFLGFGCIRFCDLIFCVDKHVDYVEISGDNLV